MRLSLLQQELLSKKALKKKEDIIISVIRSDYALLFYCIKKVKSTFNTGCRSPPKVQFKKF